jgi:serine protease Do
MRTSPIVSALLLLLAHPACASEPSLPRVIDDLQLMRLARAGLGELADAKQGLGGAKLKEAQQKAPASAEIAMPVASASPAEATYEDVIGSVAMLTSVYKCGKCDKWHLGGAATAWCLAADGVFVTNHHVFESASGDLTGICTVDGRVAPVTEILASDRASDVCVFRVGGDGFKPLALGQPAAVGTKVRVLSHPAGRFFYQSSGEVARYHQRPARGMVAASVWMSITADYARGSSGGPVMDSFGRVVGMVSSTQSINYKSSGKVPEGALQMVVKNCVPVAAIRKLAKAPEVAESKEP